LADPATAFLDAPVAPPVVELGRWAGWRPLPLTVRAARRAAGELRDAFATAPPTGPPPRPGREVVARVVGVSHRYGPITALDRVDLDVFAGQVTAVMGRNGAGKTTLLRHLAGLATPGRGQVAVDGHDPATLGGGERIRRVGLVPQDPGLLLYAQRVDEECCLADEEGGLAPGTTAAELERLAPGLPADRHPRELSEGQRLCLALAVVLAHRPSLVVLDEPTRGLDYAGKARLTAELSALADDGAAVVLATHDVEFAAVVADRVVVLSEGTVLSDGPSREVVCHSQVFAPQVAKVFAPTPVLSVAEVVEAWGTRP
jgi:energy-coupling factor transport system ATP-binding protein